MASKPSADRLNDALAALTSLASDGETRVTVAALCRRAEVSRNSLYRYHPDVLRALREHQQHRDAGVSMRLRNAVHPQQAEFVALRDQTVKLTALVDHFYAAYRETQALLTRREQELAQLRRRLDSKPAALAR